MDIKMIVTDLDGTLLRSDKTVSEYTIRVFRRAQELGMLVAFATARDFRFVTEHITPLSGIEPDIIIADNGALARYKGNDLYKRLIPAKTTNTLLSRFELVRCTSTEKAYYLSNDYSNDHWSIGKKATIIVDSIGDLEDGALYVDGNVYKSSESVTVGIPNVRAVTYSDVSFVTVVHLEASKLNALAAVKTALNIKDCNIAVFGDDFSDIEVLSSFANSVAVANAIDEVKSVADFICDTNDNDGVAKWLEENVL